MSDPYGPTPADRFTFGLWTVGHPGRDPFGEPVRAAPPPTEVVARLSKLGAFGVNLHDDDLVPFGCSLAERDRIVREFKTALSDHGMVVPMATTNLFTHPIFKDGAFTSNDARVRAFAIRKTMRAIDLGVELGAKIYVMWGGREGVEVDASKDPRDALRRYRDAIDFLCEYVRDRRYELRFALEAKPNEPRSDLYLPTTGHMLAFIETLAHPEMVGVNPEVAHEQMSGLSFHHGIAQALDRKKLFHIDLNGQKPGRYDQDLRFASESLKGMFFLVKLLVDAGYDGPKHFDAHAYRTEDGEGVWDFARGCMRTYKILEEKARRFACDAEIQAALSEARRFDDEEPLALGEGGLRGYTRDKADRLAHLALDPAALGRRGWAYERLDQLVVELLLGVR